MAVVKRNRERITKLRTIIRYMLERGTLAPGDQSRLAEHFSLTRQRVNQLVGEERRSMSSHSASKPVRTQTPRRGSSLSG